nr:adapter molecule Crk [Leptinotarsa decemlineata]
MMASSFDHEDKDCWYFGAIGRHEATDLLMSEREGGVFLVRDSKTSVGDFVLCVKEDSKVSHYIINKTQVQDQARYKIGDNFFKNIPELLAFYKVHYLDTTPLIRPASKKVEKVVAKFDFDGKEKDDLSFKKGDILTILFKDEEQWWTAKNKDGQTGSIPVPYVQKIEESHSPVDLLRSGSGVAVNNTLLPCEAAKRNQMQVFIIFHKKYLVVAESVSET